MYFWLSCGAAGCSICSLIWVFTRPVITHGGTSAAYSHQLVLRLIWPWVSVFASLCKPFISWRTRQGLVKLIQVAGLDPVWKAEHIVAMQCLSLLVFGSCSGLALGIGASYDWGHGVLLALLVGGAAAWWPRYRLRGQGAARQRLMLKEFPFLLDMTTLCVEAGLNLQGALQQAAQHGPVGPLRHELRGALADMRAGVPRLEALIELANRTDLVAVRQLATALGQADQLGMSLGPLLRAQSEQRRAERFLRAEKLALEAPVKMLFPMVFCIFPCTFLIIGFPIVVKLMGVEL
ncbi:MAG: type II secretion system F family protein [Burkholderiaceae bacterium]